MSEWWLMHWGPSLLPPEERIVWGWSIATAYVFAGTSGMIMALAAVEGWRGRAPALSRVGMVTGAIGLMIASAILVLDLGMPWRFLNLILAIPSRVLSSPMTWGVVVLGAMPLLGIYSAKFGTGGRVLGTVIIALGVLTATYPGFLLNATSIALWNAYLPPLFLFASLSVAAAFMALAASLFISEPDRREAAVKHMEVVAIASTGAELFLVLFLIFAATGEGRALSSLHALLGQEVGVYFWTGVGLTVLAAIGLLFTVVIGAKKPVSGPGSLLTSFAVAATGSFLLRASLFLAGYAAFAAMNPFGGYHIQIP